MIRMLQPENGGSQIMMLRNFSLPVIFVLTLLPMPMNVLAYGEDDYNNGIKYLESKQYSLAIKSFNRAIEDIDKEYLGKAYEMRGCARVGVQDYEGALQDFITAKRYGNLGLFLSVMYYNSLVAWQENLPKLKEGKRLYSEGNNVKAYKILSEVSESSNILARECHDILSIINDKTSTFVSNGRNFHSQKKYDEAINEYNKCLNYKSDHIYAQYKRGIAYYEIGNYEDAVNDILCYVKTNPSNHEPYYWLGVAQFKNGSSEKAIKYLTKSYAMGSFDALVARAHVRKYAGDIDGSIGDYTSIIMERKSSMDYYNRSNLYIKKGFYSWAVNDLEESIKLDRKNTSALNTLAWIRATCKDSTFHDGSMAINLAERAKNILEKSGNVATLDYVALIDTLAASYARDNQFKKAIVCQNDAIKLANKYNMQAEHISELENHLELYKKNKQYIDE